MNKMGSMANFPNMARQSRNSLQEVASGMQEIARVYEDLMKINSLMKSISTHSNFLSMKALELIHAGDADRGLAIIAHEARGLAEFADKQSKAIGNMLAEINESICKIGCSATMEAQGRGNSSALLAAGTEQVSKALEVVSELDKIKENLSLLAQSVSRFKV